VAHFNASRKAEGPERSPRALAHRTLDFASPTTPERFENLSGSVGQWTQMSLSFVNRLPTVAPSQSTSPGSPSTSR